MMTSFLGRRLCDRQMLLCVFRSLKTIKDNRCLVSTAAVTSTSYRQRRETSLMANGSCNCRRKVHTRANQKQNQKLSANESKSLETSKSSQDKNVSRTDSVHVPAPKPELKEIKSSLPTHDVKRITNENRALEVKASGLFDDLEKTRGRSKETFLLAIKKYISKESLYRRGAVEFMYTGLEEIKRFGLAKDLDTYKALLQVLPEGKMIPRNAWQVEFMHYPRQQQCVIDMLEQMEHNAIVPDDEFGTLLKNRFGNEAHVTRKYRRMMYWLPKFKNMNPYPVPFELPQSPEELALLALKRMSVDRETKYTVWKTSEEEPDCEEDTFIASAQSPIQQDLLRQHKSGQPLFVEGPYPVYMRDTKQQYFLLRAEPNVNALMKRKQIEKEEANDENLCEWINFWEEESKELCPVLSIHEQEDSTILALTITGTSSKSSVVSWIRYLERDNHSLAQTPVLFKLLSAENQVDVIGDNRPFMDMPS